MAAWCTDSGRAGGQRAGWQAGERGGWAHLRVSPGGAGVAAALRRCVSKDGVARRREARQHRQRPARARLRGGGGRAGPARRVGWAAPRADGGCSGSGACGPVRPAGAVRCHGLLLRRSEPARLHGAPPGLVPRPPCLTTPASAPLPTCAASSTHDSRPSRAAPAAYSEGGPPSAHSRPSSPGSSSKRSSAASELRGRAGHAGGDVRGRCSATQQKLARRKALRALRDAVADTSPGAPPGAPQVPPLLHLVASRVPLQQPRARDRQAARQRQRRQARASAAAAAGLAVARRCGPAAQLRHGHAPGRPR
jgi:hypothetical protein